MDAISGNVDSSTVLSVCIATFSNPEGSVAKRRKWHNRHALCHQEQNHHSQEATYELQDKVFVYRVVNGKAKSTEIKVIEHSDGEHYVVLSGLSVGDRIISEGAGLLFRKESKIK